MVLTMFHSPVRSMAFAGVGAAVGSDLAGAVLVGLVSGVDGETCDLFPSVGEYHLFIPNSNATAPAPSITARTIMAACKTQRYGEREDCEGLEGTPHEGIVGRAADTNVGSESGSAKREEPSSKQKFSESSLYPLLHFGHRFMEIWIVVQRFRFSGVERVPNDRRSLFPCRPLHAQGLRFARRIGNLFNAVIH
jgi:hypothetical protein